MKRYILISIFIFACSSARNISQVNLLDKYEIVNNVIQLREEQSNGNNSYPIATIESESCSTYGFKTIRIVSIKILKMNDIVLKDELIKYMFIKNKETLEVIVKYPV